ncbi:YceI family protein [Anatilimnocola floriformis]|uniref:YceI family protein n=1 Tax=Anatilimnocola floriformis TaxID=2948575 RepID=UPI0020C3BBA0|nr:YceI family protein [Anatilimnocola floriformis]
MRTLALGLVLGFVTANVFAANAVPVDKGAAAISAANSKIAFVGTHSGDKPDPRVGGFGKFTGKVTVDSTGKLTGVTADIDATSIFTAIPKLTDHLKTADFLEVREYPTAKFESTKVTPGKEGTATVTGKLTLHGKTQEISFPVTYSMSAEGLSLKSDFTINRGEFGMTYGAGKVDDKVSLSVVVGEKTTAP